MSKASELLIVKVDAITKQQEDLRVLMTAQYTALTEELATIQEKLANQEKKKPPSRAGSKSVPSKTPTGKRTYGNKMIWWKDMFATHYDQYSEELFTEELNTAQVLAEAEAEMEKPKNKDKEGAVRYKAMADYIWRNYLKTDTHKEFKALVFRKFEEYHDSADTTTEAKKEDDGDNVAAPESEDAPTEENDDEDDDDDNDQDEEEATPKKAPAKKTTPKKAPAKKTTPKKAPAKKAPAKK